MSIIDKNVLKAKSDLVWEEICVSLESKIKRDNLYFKIKQNRDNLLSDCLHVTNQTLVNDESCLKRNVNEKNIDYETVSKVKDKVDCASNESNNSELSESDGDKPKSKKRKTKTTKFEITMSSEKWDKIKPVNVIYQDGRECEK